MFFKKTALSVEKTQFLSLGNTPNPKIFPPRIKPYGSIILYISTIVKSKSIFYNSSMISYEPFYKTLKTKKFSTYKLINEYKISRSLIDRLKHNKPITTVTLNDLCKILDCRVEDIVVYIPEN